MRILLAEDDPLIADGLRSRLRRDGLAVDWVENGQDALDALKGKDHDLLVLDLGLPLMDGLEVLRHLRQEIQSPLPVLILTAQSAVEDRVKGLESGADDYLFKPFAMDEFLARCRALLRRQQPSSLAIMKLGEYEIDRSKCSVSREGTVIELTPKAFQILVILAENANRVFSKEEIAAKIYGWEDQAESNTVEVYVSQIRRNLGPSVVRTIRGVGYTVPGDQV